MKSKKIFIGLLIIMLISIEGSIVALPKNIGEKVDISIYYDAKDMSISKIARNIKIIANTSGVSINSYIGLKGITKTASKINIFIFHGTQKGVKIGSKYMTWRKFSMIISSVKKIKQKYFILAICHSNMSLKYLPLLKDRIKTVEGEINLEMAEIFIVASLSEIIKSNKNTIDPKTYKNLVLRFSTYLTGSLEKMASTVVIPVQKTLGNTTIEQLEENNTDYTLIPYESYFSGPIGKIIDTILHYVVKYIIEKIGEHLNNTYGNGTAIVTDDGIAITKPFVEKTNLSFPSFGGNKLEFNLTAGLDFSVNPFDRAFSVGASVELKGVGGALEQVLAEATGNVINIEVDISGGISFNFIVDILALGGNIRELIKLQTITVNFGITLTITLDILRALSMLLSPTAAKTLDNVLKVLEYFGVNINLDLIFYIGIDVGISYNIEKKLTILTLYPRLGMKLVAEVSVKRSFSFLGSLKFGIRLEMGLEGGGIYTYSRLNSSLTAYVKAWVILELDLPDMINMVLDIIEDVLGFSLKPKYETEQKIFEKTWVWSASDSSPPEGAGPRMNEDRDNDGLSDQTEADIGTDPSNPDTDSDGLTDSNEYFEYLTDPTKADSDGDGIDDGDEVSWVITHGFHPLVDTDMDGLPNIIDADSDNDGIPDGVEIDTYNTDPIRIDTDNDGLNDSFEITVIGSDPTTPDTDLDSLDDQSEVSIQTNITFDDTDGDGLNDGEEVLTYSTDPLLWDTDGDGLNDGIETSGWTIRVYQFIFEWGGTYGVYSWYVGHVYSDPLDNDTDDDGLNDYSEYVNGSNPQDNDTDRDGWIDSEENYTSPISADTDMDRIQDSKDSNPTQNDSDDDKLLDYDENLIGTDPLDPDTDDDGIQDGLEANYLEKTFGSATVDTDGDGNPNILDNDSDNDGLNDSYEINVLLTDPYDPDTDGDGLSDSDEVGISNPLKVDTDEDYVDDYGEVIAGTNITNPDTDGDGLLDGFEMKYGTNPLLWDTDGDGLSDLEEYHKSTSPFMSDTDGDGLSDFIEVNGYNICYHEPPNNWEIGPFFSSPVLVDTDGDGLSDYEETYLSFSSPVLVDTDGDGLSDYDELFLYGTNPTDPDSDDDNITDFEEIFGLFWSFIAVSSSEYSRSKEGKSDNSASVVPYSGDSRALYWTGNRFFDWSIKPYVGSLEPWNVRAITNPLDPDTDNDGVIDGLERDLCINPRNPDTDGDGVLDGEELNMSLNPRNPDTDGDRLLDGEELDYYGTSPINRDSDHDGLIDGEEVSMNLDPLDPDSDDDYLSDGEEVNGIRMTLFNSTTGRFEEVLITTNPLDPDTDNDGIFDGAEIFLGTDPSSLDTDSDMIDDWREIQLGINASNPDTDGDGLTDYEEIVLDMDPHVSDENSNGMLDGMEIDYDNDGIPDYYELYMYGTYWYTNDSDADGLGDYWESLYNATNPLEFDAFDDPDGDGLSNYDEYIYNTNPDTWDSDEDNISDYVEIFITLTDPLLWDTDGDYLNDGEEYYTYNTDPLKWDTDGDGLGDGEEVDRGLDPLIADITPPSISVSFEPKEPHIGDVLLISGVVYDSSGVSSITIIIEHGGKRITKNISSLEFEEEYDLSEEGEYTIIIMAKDAAGNIAVCEIHINVKSLIASYILLIVVSAAIIIALAISIVVLLKKKGKL